MNKQGGTKIYKTKKRGRHMPVPVVGQLYHSSNTKVIAITAIWWKVVKLPNSSQIREQWALIRSVSLKKHQYSKGITISCEINGTDYYLDTVFEKSFMYEVLSVVSIGDFIILSGFIEDSSIILTYAKKWIIDLFSYFVFYYLLSS